MRLKYNVLTFVALAAAALLGMGEARAQTGDTLIVEWETEPGSGIVQKNALRDAIINDTERPEGRVYQLRRGGFYWITDRITNNGFNLTIVGQNASQGRPEDNVCGESGTADCGPAIIQRVSRDDGSTPDGTMFEAYDDLTVKNVWIMGQTDVGNLANYEPIKLLGDGKNYVFDRVIFDRNDWHHLGPDGPNSDFWITNSEFRNIFGPTQIWEGLGIRFEVGADSVVIENNTFFNIGFTPFQSEAAPVNYLRFNHNTLINVGRSFQAGAIWKEAYVTNNLFVNPFIQGESPDQYSDPEREDPYTGFFGISALPSQYGVEEQRRIVLNNNLYWRDPLFDAIYAEQEIRPQPLVNDTTQGWFDRYEHMVKEGNIEGVRPNLTVYPWTQQMTDSFEVWIADLYANPAVTPAPRWFWDPGRDEENFVNSNWPLPENFTYDNAQLLTAGTDGLPLGDLNWFPQAKATFESNKAEYVAEIEQLAGGVVQITPIALIQAETGTTDDATVEAVEGETSFYMQGAGSITWTFDVPSDGVYSFKLYSQSQDAVRGEHIFVNGTEVRNNAGYGEYYFEGLSNTEWKPYEISQANLIAGGDALNLQAGTNTVKITPSWGYQGFNQLDVIDAGGNTVLSLDATDAVGEGVQERCADGVYCPSGFKSVMLDANGSVTFNVDVPGAGTHFLRVFYASPVATDAQITVNGQAGVAPDFSVGADTADVTTGTFSLDAGVNTITISSVQGGFSIDQVQLLRLGEIVSGAGRDNLPDGYALAQNAPNPFRGSTTIGYTLKAASDVRIVVYDLLGRKVATLVDRRMGAGTHQVRWNGLNASGAPVSSGVYVYRMETSVGQKVRTMVIVR